MPELRYIVAAYAVAWTVIIGFTLYVVSRARRAEANARARVREA